MTVSAQTLKRLGDGAAPALWALIRVKLAHIQYGHRVNTTLACAVATLRVCGLGVLLRPLPPLMYDHSCFMSYDVFASAGLDSRVVTREPLFDVYSTYEN